MSAAALVLALVASVQDAAAGWSASVGMPVTVRDLVLPGSELEPVPAAADAPLVVRLDAARPHGDGFRYDLEVYALEPGEHDLRTVLRRRDGSAAELPALPFRVHALLPPGQVEPHTLASGRSPLLGGYRAALVLGALVWLAGLAWLVRRRRRALARPAEVATRARTVAELVQELADRALGGGLDAAGRAELERGVIGLLTERHGLADRDPAAALEVLRGDADAGPLLAALEDWLHRPDGREADLARLLAPYRAAAAGAGATAQPAGAHAPELQRTGRA